MFNKEIFRLKRDKIILSTLAIVAILFGLATIKEGSAVLLFDPTARIKAGNYVPFVVWANVFAGFLYIATGVAILIENKWAKWMSILLALFTTGIFIALGVHIITGGLYELRTVIAMTIRTAFWIIVAFLITFLNNKNILGEKI